MKSLCNFIDWFLNIYVPLSISFMIVFDLAGKNFNYNNFFYLLILAGYVTIVIRNIMNKFKKENHNG